LHLPSFRPRFLFKHIPFDLIELPKMRPCRADRETAMTILRPDPGCQETFVHLIRIVGKYHGWGCVASVPSAGEDCGPSERMEFCAEPEKLEQHSITTSRLTGQMARLMTAYQSGAMTWPGSNLGDGGKVLS